MDVKEIKKLRKQLELTQKDLAKLSGVSQSLIAKVEAEEIDPAYSKIMAIFEALEMEQKKKETKKNVEDIMSKNIIFANPGDNLGKILEIMKKRAISQIPVVENEKSIGSISENMFIEWIGKYGDGIGRVKVAEVMGPGFPIVPYGADVSVSMFLLKRYKAVLVQKEGIIGIITKADLIKAIGE